jgi:outer membrane protein OmpA-like peptidoglycan-associated protein
MKRLIFLFSIFICMASPTLVRAVEFSDVMELRVDNPYFSPNGDGMQDNLFFTPVLKSEWDVNRWRLEITSAEGKLVAQFTGAGFSSLIQWDGKDRKGKLLPEGIYRAILLAWGPGFKIQSESESIVIDNTAPVADLKLSSPASSANFSYAFTGKAQDNSAVDRWQFQILGVTGRTVFVQWSTGPATNLTWDGRDQASGLAVPPGPYKAVFQAWDKAGNQSMPVFLDFSVAVSVNEEMKKLVKNIKPVDSLLGLLVQLDSKDLFLISDGKPQIRRKALPILNEVALLINAYPAAQIRVDGYCFAFNQSAKDRDVSSLYAWAVYSYFVKQGNVKASRLTVRGRGRVAPDDRINISPPFLRNGIEVILLGQKA